MRRRLIFLGPPASGKGTQAALVSEQYSIPTMSTGAILRKEFESQENSNSQEKQWLKSGGLVPDQLVFSLVVKWLDGHGDSFLLDGFPRTLGQAESLDEELKNRNLPIDAAILMDLSDQEIVQRVIKRLVCDSCGKTFSSDFGATDCPQCKTPLTRRSDDSQEVLERRLHEYREKTAPLVQYYKQQDKLFSVYAGQSREDVFSDLKTIIKGGSLKGGSL